MVSALDSVNNALAGRQLTAEDQSLLLRYVGGGGSFPQGQEWWDSSGNFRPGARYSATLTIGQRLAAIQTGPDRDWYSRMGTPSLAQEVAMGANVVPGLAATPAGLTYTPPPLPHPDASNQAIGPNLGGADGVFLPGDAKPTQSTTMATGGFGGILLIGGFALVIILLAKKK